MVVIIKRQIQMNDQYIFSNPMLSSTSIFTLGKFPQYCNCNIMELSGAESNRPVEDKSFILFEVNQSTKLVHGFLKQSTMFLNS